MTAVLAAELIADVFSQLTPTHHGRLRHHLDRKTPILCGDKASWFTDGKGGGCPAVLASEWAVPHVEVHDDPSDLAFVQSVGHFPRWMFLVDRLREAVDPGIWGARAGHRFREALAELTPELMTLALRRAISH